MYLWLQHEIVRIPVAGGLPQQVVSKLPDFTYVSGMDASGGAVFWTTYPIFGGESCLWRADGDGSHATAIECGLRPYGSVRADDSSVIVVRGLEIVRFPIRADPIRTATAR